ncbi:MAG: sterol desaturase family protein [Deltaproteobacteria bacterium]|nr:sterol desaturase family protein [Deltaproteobacteria bacterium]
MKASCEFPRVFENRILEITTRSPWWMVPLLWLPTSAALIYMGPKGWALALIPVGMFAWTLTEYALHRFLFHYEFTSEAGKLFHKMVHGAHHILPNDPYRAGTPLGLSIPFAFSFALIFYWLLGPEWFFPFYAGVLLGYVVYERVHYAAHHIKSKRPWFMKLKRHHLLHHHSKAAAGTKFGVTNMFWDRVFGT